MDDLPGFAGLDYNAALCESSMAVSSSSEIWGELYLEARKNCNFFLKNLIFFRRQVGTYFLSWVKFSSCLVHCSHPLIVCRYSCKMIGYWLRTYLSQSRELAFQLVVLVGGHTLNLVFGGWLLRLDRLKFFDLNVVLLRSFRRLELGLS